MRILTFDIEEWFHILDNASTRTEREWNSYETRIHRNMESIFELLDQQDLRATFFIVGWIAEKYPEVVLEIDKRGYEIGSHTHMHQLVYEQGPKAFKSDVERSIKTLEDTTGKKVISFRAPGFSITEKTPWAFEILSELGIRKDSSIFPAGRAHGGFKSYGKAEPTLLTYQGVSLKEFPINTTRILNKKLIFSGGGYFRITPYRLITHFTDSSDYVMSYFHPRDFDIDQPIIQELSMARKFKSYIGLRNCKLKLQKWISDYEFMDMKEADGQINWSEASTVNISD